MCGCTRLRSGPNRLGLSSRRTRPVLCGGLRPETTDASMELLVDHPGGTGIGVGMAGGRTVQAPVVLRRAEDALYVRLRLRKGNVVDEDFPLQVRLGRFPLPRA